MERGLWIKGIMQYDQKMQEIFLQISQNNSDLKINIDILLEARII